MDTCIRLTSLPKSLALLNERITLICENVAYQRYVCYSMQNGMQLDSADVIAVQILRAI